MGEGTVECVDEIVELGLELRAEGDHSLSSALRLLQQSFFHRGEDGLDGSNRGLGKHADNIQVKLILVLL